MRANRVPVRPPAGIDLHVAFAAALAVYYFPGMWEWDRAIVHPLARQALGRSIEQQADAAGVSSAPVERLTAEAEALLARYVEWAPTVDDFVPIRVETDFEVPCPDPEDPSRDLVTPAGDPIHYRGRIDLLVVDDDDNYWIVEHRAAPDGWTDTDLLLIDQRSASFCWAWESFFLGMRIAGVIFNEIRSGGAAAIETGAPSAPSPPVQPAAVPGMRHRRMYVEAARAPSGAVTQQESRHFRRTRVPKSPAELEALRRQMAHEALDMVAPEVRVYPNPTLANCTPCAYRAPCMAANTGAGAAEILASAAYRDGGEDHVVEGRLGGVSWAMGRGAAPPKFRGRRSNDRRSTDERSRNKEEGA